MTVLLMSMNLLFLPCLVVSGVFLLIFVFCPATWSIHPFGLLLDMPALLTQP